MWKKNKWSLMISVIVLLLPAVTGSFIPFVLLPVHLLAFYMTGKDKKNEDQNRKVFRMVFFICPLLSIYTTAFEYAVRSGMEFGADAVTMIMIGIMFILVGNYLPKCKQNYTIGIKVPWVYTSEENWNRTHRFGGKVWVIGGLLLTIAVLLPRDWKGIVITAGILSITLIPVVYSYLFYRKEKEAGLALPAKAVLPMRGAASGIFTVVILIIVGFMFVTGDIEMTCKEETLVIEADYWDDLTIRYDSVTKMEYREEGVSGSRTGGYGSMRLLMGTFENDEFGYYTRYTYTGCDSAIVLYRDRGELVLSLADEEETRELYLELQNRIKE